MKVEGTLLMSQKERDRLRIVGMVKGCKITLIKAAELSGISYRHCKRVYKRYREEGDKGLIHRSRGRPSNRRKDPASRRAVLERYEARYKGFGPTLANEKLEKEGYFQDHETLRRWLLKAGLWTKQRKRKAYRSWRERKAHRGEMVQMDGSDHAWFEERGGRAVLMDMVDDATGTTLAQFHPGETTHAAMRTLWGYIKRYGIPRALYVDKDAIFVTNREPTIKEELAGEQPRTQFGRAVQKLGINIIPANSPQAKGRVERKNGVYQDRLVKELRLEAVNTIEGGNRVLAGGFLDDINKRFAVEPRNSTDLHRPLPQGLDLKRVFCFEEERVINNDWTVRYQGRVFQIKKGAKVLPPARKKVLVQEWLDGSIHLFYREQEVEHQEITDKLSMRQPAVTNCLWIPRVTRPQLAASPQ
jgi:transposase